MEDFQSYRSNVAHSASAGSSIKEALRDEIIWETKIKQIKNLLKNKVPVRAEKQKEVIALGSKVVVRTNGHEKRVVIDGAGYKNKDVEVISILSFVGQQLVGKKVGETIIGKNGADISIKEIEYPW